MKISDKEAIITGHCPKCKKGIMINDWAEGEWQSATCDSCEYEVN